MLGERIARTGGIAIAGIALSCLLVASAAHAALPSVSSGERPGPPILYAPPADAPQLSLSAPFTASPLLISGTDAYRNGEYLYQDYLFDDRGADTVPAEGSRPDNLESGNFSPTAGDVQYPTAERYAGNAADLVELRIKPTATHLVYRVTLNSVVQPDTTVVGIGIDTDRSGGAEVEWPNGAGVSSPGLDRFITAWGTGGEVTTLPGGAATALPDGAVSIDLDTKQMTISVPRSILDPTATDVWRHVAGTGLWNSTGHSWKTPTTGNSPSVDNPASGNPVVGAPAVFNLAFRFDEPQTGQVDDPPLPLSTFPGTGNWFEDKQAHLLGAVGGSTTTAGVGAAGGSDFSADVDFAKLAAGADEDVHAPQPTQARIMASGLGLPQGVKSTFPEYGGQLQPYLLRVPAGTNPSSPAPLTFALHSLGGNYNQFSVFSPNQFVQLGDERDNLVATPLAHGPDGWYTDEAESDVFEVWADIDRHFNLDPDRTYVSGYSMGGYGSYKLGVEYPDLWARAFTVVGPPGEGIWIPGAPGGAGIGAETLTRDLLENVRWVPYLNWAGSTDELVPVPGPVAQQQRFDELGLRSSLVVFAPSDHFALAVIDEWAEGRDFLGDATVAHDPSRVDYAFFPAADRHHLRLVHDHAYWVSNLKARDTSAGDAARAEISARSLAHGDGDPETATFGGPGFGDKGPPLGYNENGTEWTGIPAVPSENALEISLENLAWSEIDGRRARLDASKELRVKLTTDGPSDVLLRIPVASGASAVRLDGTKEVPAPEVNFEPFGYGGSYVSFRLTQAGTATYLLRPTGAQGPTPPGGGGGGGQGQNGGGGNGGNGQGGGGGSNGRGGVPRCQGRAATKLGTIRNDTIRGTSGDDVIASLGGDDRVRGRGGNDVICGNGGDDSISGGGGQDSCRGGGGRDAVVACESPQNLGRRR